MPIGDGDKLEEDEQHRGAPNYNQATEKTPTDVRSEKKNKEQITSSLPV